MDEAASDEETKGVQEAPEAGHPQLVILVAALADLLFTGAVAVRVAFADAWGWPVTLVAASAAAFLVSTVVALVAKRKGVVVVATVLLALAGVGAAVSAVESGRRYDVLRHRVFGDRVGVRLVEPSSADGRRMGGAMLASITSSLAAIAALPLAGYLALRVIRPDPTS